jgi:hypothetical protein
MQPNQKTDAFNADIPPYILEFGADISTTTGAAQNIPKAGTITSDTSTVGQYCGRNTSWVTRLRFRFVGAAGNVAGQTVNCSVVVLTAAGATTTYSALLTTPLATTAGQKDSGIVVLATPFKLDDGDYVRGLMTPSAGLTTGVSNVALVLS